MYLLLHHSDNYHATPFATFTNVSIPTTSAVRNVADFGRPMIGPVNASISSIVNSNLSTNSNNGHHTKYTNTVGNKCRSVFTQHSCFTQDTDRHNSLENQQFQDRYVVLE